MMRILTILILLVGGLPRLGVGLSGGEECCGSSACAVPRVEVGCCGSPAEDSESELACRVGSYCPMSGGRCRCGVSPSPAPERVPDAPLPESGRDGFTGLVGAPVTVQPVVEPDRAASPRALCIARTRAGRAHNEIRALLGNWRT